MNNEPQGGKLKSRDGVCMQPYLWGVLMTLAFTQSISAQETTSQATETLSVGQAREKNASSDHAMTLSSQQPSVLAQLFLEQLELPETLVNAAITTVQQHPDDRRWSGRVDTRVFAVSGVPLPRRSQAAMVPSRLKLATALAVNTLLQNDALLAGYEKEGLDDINILRQAVLQVACEIDVLGSVKRMMFHARRQDHYAFSLVFADAKDISTALLEPARSQLVRTKYRHVMQTQVRQFMQRENWQEARLLWNHLHERKLVSPSLYVDATRCFQALELEDEVIKTVDDALTTFAQHDDWMFFERLGEFALPIETPKAQKLAESAFTIALKKYDSRKSTSQTYAN